MNTVHTFLVSVWKKLLQWLIIRWLYMQKYHVAKIMQISRRADV